MYTRNNIVCLSIIILALIAGLVVKLFYSEQLRIAWNNPRYFYDGRHKVDGDSRAVFFDLAGELWVRDKVSTQYVRIIPRAGLELSGEQNVSFVSARSGQRAMFKLRPQCSGDARDDYSPMTWAPASNQYFLYFEQRAYSNDVLRGHYKDAAYGPGGLFFVDPATGDHIAHSNFSTLYVPPPTTEAHAGPPAWLWAAAANRAFVETTVTGAMARRDGGGRMGRALLPPQPRAGLPQRARPAWRPRLRRPLSVCLSFNHDWLAAPAPRPIMVTDYRRTEGSTSYMTTKQRVTLNIQHRTSNIEH
ncbi:MAG: hypothetical protein NTV22_17295 [bacterium]|nr:hypothetical protein [bacterium]